MRKHLDSRKDNYYDGKNIKDLIRAIRNINEHWFDKNEKLDNNEQQLRKEALECFNYIKPELSTLCSNITHVFKMYCVSRYSV